MKLDEREKILNASKNLIEKYSEIGEVGKIGKIILGLVLVELKNDDPISALKMLYLLPETQIFNFEMEMSAAKSLIKAYEDYDDERFQQCLKSGIWRDMDNEYLRLMRVLKAPKNELGEHGNTQNTTKNNQNDDDEEEDLR